ncbi:MAG: serine--tRNA ligase, partial [Bacteroidota bacterium]
MLDPQFLRDYPDRVREAIEQKRTGDPAVVDTALEADRQRRESITELQALQQRQGELGKQIGPLMKAGKREEAQGLLAESNEVKAEIKALEATTREHEAAFQAAMLEIPNVPQDDVPVGATPEDNVVAFEWGEKPSFDFEPLAHWDLAERHGLIDWERGAKVAGAG